MGARGVFPKERLYLYVCVFVVVFKIVITFARLSFDPTNRMQYVYICLLSI